MIHRGTYDGTIYYNPANKFCIISVKTAEKDVPEEARSIRRRKDHLIRFVATGYELPRTDAVELELDGEWKKGKYGMQLQVEQWHEIVPQTKSGVEGYLASGLIKGIGPALAKQIVSRFGVETLDILQNRPERLLEIKGITENKLEAIKTSYAESRMLQDLMTLLSPFKITPKTAQKIYQFFGPASVDILKKSPFELCQISGFGFLRVDAIVQKNGGDLRAPMGYFSEMALNKQEELGLPAEQVSAGNAFEDEETFDELPVPSASHSAASPTVETPSSPAFDADDGAEELAEMNGDDASEAADTDGEDAGKEQEAPAKADATTDADEEKRRAEHEAAEAKRKAEWEARQAEKKKAEQEQLERLAAMSDDEVVNASMQRVNADTEKLTRRNMKECVAEFIQTKCLEDIAFARLTMHPRKSMIHCFQYISRKAWDYIQDELKASGIQPGPGSQGYGCDVPDDLCYQWAEDYFRDPDAKEDHKEEEKFVPNPYYGKDFARTTKKKQKEKKKAEAKPKPVQKEKPANDGQLSLLDLGMTKAG